MIDSPAEVSQAIGDCAGREPRIPVLKTCPDHVVRRGGLSAERMTWERDMREAGGFAEDASAFSRHGALLR